jgi:general secretion pathway protein D
MAWVAGVLLVAALASPAQAQKRLLVTVNTPATPSTLGVQTTVVVPDGGTVTVGSYSQASESRVEYGAPVLGKAPYVGRGFRNVGYGRSLSTRKVGVTARVIDLREEEFRQTGFRSR